MANEELDVDNTATDQMPTSDLDTIDLTTTPQQAAAREKLRKLIVERGAKPLTIEELHAMGDLWPENESVDDFLQWREQMRKEDRSRSLP